MLVVLLVVMPRAEGPVVKTCVEPLGEQRVLIDGYAAEQCLRPFRAGE